jgi:hypothetical protein
MNLTKGKKFLSDIKFYTDYSKWIDEEKKYETWKEACKAVMNTHRDFYGKKLSTAEYNVLVGYIDEAELAYSEKLLLASQRNLQFRGEQIINKNERMYNCSTLYLDKIENFNKAFYLTLCGCGVGVNMLRRWVNKLPRLKKRTGEVKNYIIPDSIEGWADASGVLVSSFCCGDGNVPFEEYKNCIIRFDYSLIREKGSFISGGFKAPGHETLKQSLEKIEYLLEREVSETSVKFRSIIAYDVLMHLADATLSGGIRRAAISIIVDPLDEEMLNAKTGNWRDVNKQRERSNNSVALKRNSFTFEEFDKLVKLNKGTSDIGFCFVNNDYEVFNPCARASTKVLTPNGIRQFKDIEAGSVIWSSEGWTTVVKKWSNGIKPVFKYETTSCIFYGTSNHRIVSNGQKIEIGLAESIDNLRGIYTNDYIISPEDVMDGLVIGDGTKHSASENLILLCIGENDKDYFNSEIKDFIIKHRPGIGNITYKIKTTITASELPKTYERRVPERFIYDKNKLVGFLRGLYSANGSVCGNRIILKASSKGLVEDVQLMLSSIGIRSYYTTNKASNVKFRNGDYLCKQSYDINITTDRERFVNVIGFIQEYKNEKIKITNTNIGQTTYNIVNVESLGEEEVFDITVDNPSHTYWTQGCNVSNCFEIGMTPILDIENEVTGIEFCNLVSLNATAFRVNGKFSKESFKRACRVGAIIGTLQAGYTNFPYLGIITEEIVKKESLIGVSISGWMNCPDLFDEVLLEEGIQIIKETNETIAKLIGINPAARLTTSKPDGNSAALLGGASGIGPDHSPRYFRIMQLNKTTEVAKWLEINMPEILEESEWSASNSDYVVYSPIETNDSTIYKKDMLGVDHLEKIKFVQRNWVDKGTMSDRNIMKDTRNSVSCTVLVNTYDDVSKYVYENQNDFVAVSFLSYYGDKDYTQAPFTSVFNSEELLTEYGDGVIFASGLIVDGLHYFDKNLWKACESVLSKDKKIEGTRAEVLLKKDWIRRAKQFSKNYFKNDTEKMIYCLKDVHLWHKWCKVNKSFKEVNFEGILSKPTYNDISNYSAIACSGSSCELI